MYGLQTAGLGASEQLYGTLRAAATCVGMLSDCRKPGLGVTDAACTTPYVLHQPPCYPELYLYMSVKTYITLDSNKTWDIPILMTYPDISLYYPRISQNKLENKNKWDITG